MTFVVVRAENPSLGGKNLPFELGATFSKSDLAAHELPLGNGINQPDCLVLEHVTSYRDRNILHVMRNFKQTFYKARIFSFQ